jgi:hypothetical protein
LAGLGQRDSAIGWPIGWIGSTSGLGPGSPRRLMGGTGRVPRVRRGRGRQAVRRGLADVIVRFQPARGIPALLSVIPALLSVPDAGAGIGEQLPGPLANAAASTPSGPLHHEPI